MIEIDPNAVIGSALGAYVALSVRVSKLESKWKEVSSKLEELAKRVSTLEIGKYVGMAKRTR